VLEAAEEHELRAGKHGKHGPFPGLDPEVEAELEAGLELELLDGKHGKHGGISGLSHVVGAIPALVHKVVAPLDACVLSAPLHLTLEHGEGCDQERAPCTLLNVNCIAPEVTNPLIGPKSVVGKIIDVCVAYDPLGLAVYVGSRCASAGSPPCTVDCGPPCTADCGPPCTADCGPPCTADCGPPCTADCGPPCTDDCGPPCTDDCGPPCTADCGPPCTADCGPPCTADCGPPCTVDCGPPCTVDCGPPCTSLCGGDATENDLPVTTGIGSASGTGGSLVSAPSPPARTGATPIVHGGGLALSPSGGAAGLAMAFVPPATGDAGLKAAAGVAPSGHPAWWTLIALALGIALMPRGLRREV
jgi:hypothetical protein